jgi:hypothetical protein
MKTLQMLNEPTPADEVRKKYASIPQIKVLLAKAHSTYVVAGRGSGKTTEILAVRLYEAIHALPGCTIVLYGKSYQQLLLNTLKELFLGWERIGFKRYNPNTKAGHFVIRKMPPENWPKPHRMPELPEYTIFFYNGACIQLMSEDVVNNGGSYQYFAADEFRFLNPDKLKQLLLTLRDDTFCKGSDYFMGVTMVTDQPDKVSQQWLFDFEKECDMEQIELIQEAQLEVECLRNDKLNAQSESTKDKIQTEINKWEKELKELRKDSVYFLETSTIDNVYGVGVEYINRQKRLLDDETFGISILGKRKKKGSKAFYPNFNEAKHTYIQFDNAYLESIHLDYSRAIKQTCLQDADIYRDRGLDVTVDSGGSINVLLCGQLQGDTYRVLKGMFVTPGMDKNIEDLAQDWCDYYEPHPTKTVQFIYDQTDMGRHSVAKHTPADAFMNVLLKNKWRIKKTYYPVVPDPINRYEFCRRLFSETENHLPKIRINAQHCDNLITGLDSTQTREGRTGFEKDKSLEKKEHLPQEKLTHFPDAFDKLVHPLSFIDGASEDNFTGTVTA